MISKSGPITATRPAITTPVCNASGETSLKLAVKSLNFATNGVRTGK